MPNPELEIRGEWGGGGGGWSTRPIVKGDPVSHPKFFWHFGPHIGPKIRGPPDPSPGSTTGLTLYNGKQGVSEGFPQKSANSHKRDGQVTAGK